MFRLILFSLCLAVPHAAQAASAADEVLASFQTRLRQGEDWSDLTGTVRDLPLAEQKALLAELDRQWPRLRDAYLNALTRAGSGAGAAKGNTREIAKHRADFKKVLAMGEGAMKEPLNTVSWPAMEELRKILMPTAEQLVEAGGETLRKQRETATALAGFRDAAIKAAIATTPADSVETLAKGEAAAAQAACGFSRKDLKILEDNRKLAAKRGVPEEEARGVEQCNEWRLLAGLGAVTLDPLLCDTARDHSKDMEEKGFFAHESPVPGKKSFTDRARNFRTTASAENIYMGSTDPAAANRGWFFSPGHHKNMFAAGHRRIGLGRHGGHWTQMFGG